jgi:hypothetical protein
LGQSHGDFIPPNISVLPGGRFNIWDWERGESDVPLGVDTMQFILFVEMRRRLDGSTGQRVSAIGRDALSRQGLNPEYATMLFMRSLLWFGEARHAGRGEDEDLSFTRVLEGCLRLDTSMAAPSVAKATARVTGTSANRQSGNIANIVDRQRGEAVPIALERRASATNRTEN